MATVDPQLPLLASHAAVQVVASAVSDSWPQPKRHRGTSPWGAGGGNLARGAARIVSRGQARHGKDRDDDGHGCSRRRQDNGMATAGDGRGSVGFHSAWSQGIKDG